MFGGSHFTDLPRESEDVVFKQLEQLIAPPTGLESCPEPPEIASRVREKVMSQSEG